MIPLIGMKGLEGYPLVQRKLIDLIDHREPLGLGFTRRHDGRIAVSSIAAGGVFGLMPTNERRFFDLTLVRVRIHPLYLGNPGFDVGVGTADDYPVIMVHQPALEALGLDPWAMRDRLRDRMDILEVGRMGDER